MPRANDRPDDPVFLHARREAIVVLVVWCICGLYTVTFCYLSGYHRSSETIQTYWGIPGWVLFGVITPWILANIFAWWFCFRFVVDQDLGEESEEPESDQNQDRPRN